MLTKSIAFLKDLAENNNRDWFQENKEKYEEAKQEFEQFTNLLIARISEFEPEMKDINAKKSIFRIYRDVRFSKNKSPYKTNFGTYIVLGGRKSSLAGYYFHLEPSQKTFIGGGIHCPQPKVLKSIRDEIYADPEPLKKIIASPDFKNYFNQIEGDQLKTAPKGFPKDFEDIALLRYKSYAQVHTVPNEIIQSDEVLNYTINVLKHAKNFNDYLNEIVKAE